MLPYILVAIFLLVLAFYFDVKGVQKGRNTFLAVATWVLILFSGLRNQLGIDTYAYSLSYSIAPTIFNLMSGDVNWLDFSTQPLWHLLTSICKTISNNFDLYG